MRLLLVAFLLWSDAALSSTLEGEQERWKIELALSKQGANRFCEKTLPAAARIKPEKRKQPYSDAVFNVARDEYGVRYSEVQNIAARRFDIGSSECALVAALGRPTKTNATVTAKHRRVQWVYRERGIHVYTVDGIVTSYQE